MSRAILCLVFVAVLASIGHGRVIEKRSPGPGIGSDIGGHIDNAIDVVGDFGSDAIDGLNDAGSAISDFFGGLGRKKRSPGVADFADQIDKAVDLKDIGGHIDTAIDAIGDFGSDAIDEIGDFFGGLGRKKRSPGADPSFGSDVGGHIDNAIDVIGDFGSDVGDAFDDAGSAISDFFG